MSTKTQNIAELLGLAEDAVPGKFSYLNDSVYSLTFFDSENTKSQIFEKEPQLFVSDVVIASLNKDITEVFGSLHITEKMCEGHFEFFKMVPLALLGQAIAQFGEFLVIQVNQNNGSERKIPLVIETQTIKAVSKKGGAHKFITPGSDLLVVVKSEGGKFQVNYVSAEVYLDGELMVQMDKIIYVSVEKSYLTGGSK